jgi:hypothetical protein
MNTRNKIPGSAALAAAVLGLLAVTACDPYVAANKAAPVVIGVTMYDVNQWGLLPDSTDCTPPYPEPDHVWAEATFPGTCTTGANYNVCPVPCYPPRTGPAFAPYYTGNLGGSYQTNLVPNTFTYETSGTYVLDNVPPTYTFATDETADYSQIRVLFNKLMDPQTIEPIPDSGIPPETLRILEGTADVTSEFIVHYEPNSDNDYWGASITATRPAGLNPNSTYRILAVVRDQQGQIANVAVTVNTGLPIDETVVPAAR